MKSLTIIFLLCFLWNYSKCSINPSDTIRVEFGNKDIHCFGKIILDSTGTISLHLKVLNRSRKMIVMVNPREVYLCIYRINNYFTVLEFMVGSQHLCPYHVYSDLPELHLQLVPAGEEFQIDNQYIVPPGPLKSEIRYEFIVAFQEIEKLLHSEEIVIIQGLKVQTRGERFFTSPNVVADDNIRKSEWGGGNETINLYSPIGR